MGLALCVFEKLGSKVASELEELEELGLDRDNLVFLRNHEHFEHNCDGLEEGFYETEGDFYSTRNTSYGFYNRFRDRLCEAFMEVPFDTFIENPLTYEGEPFFKLIFFSDSDGFIGPDSSATIYEDFNKYPQVFDYRVKEKYGLEESLMYKRVYSSFKKAFRLAAGEGVVRFS